MDRFSGKRAFITGGSSGIGLEAARALASRGAHVAVFARDPRRLDSALGRIEAALASRDQRFYRLSMDVSDHEDVEEKTARAVREFGAPDILIHSAGIGHAGYFEDTSYEDFDHVMRTNLYGTRNVVASLLPHMKGRGGHMVVVSALAGLVGPFGWSSYAASKFAQVGLCESLRPDLARYGIAVSVYCPAEVRTPLSEHMLGTSPPEAKALARTVDRMIVVMSPERAAEELLKGMERKKFLILAGSRSKILYFAGRNLSGLSRAIMDLTAKRAAGKGTTGGAETGDGDSRK